MNADHVHRGYTMPRALPVLATVLMMLSVSTASTLAADEAVAQEMQGQRVAIPAVGVALTVPSDWSVLTPTGARVSEIVDAEGEPIYVTTAMTALAGDGRWCDTEVYLDVPAPLDEHAYAYAGYLQQVHGAHVLVAIVTTELPAGPAYNISVYDRERARQWVKYLFDGSIAEDGAVHRVLITCVGPLDAEPFWAAIAESAEVFAATDPEAAVAPEPSPGT